MLNFEKVVRYITKKKFEKYQKDPVALGNYVCSLLLENDDDNYAAEFCPGCNFADICKDAVDSDQKPIEYLGRWLLKEAKTPSYEEKLESIVGKELYDYAGEKIIVSKDEEGNLCLASEMRIVVSKDEEGELYLGCMDPDMADKAYPMVSGKVLVNLLKAIDEVDNDQKSY